MRANGGTDTIDDFGVSFNALTLQRKYWSDEWKGGRTYITEQTMIGHKNRDRTRPDRKTTVGNASAKIFGKFIPRQKQRRLNKRLSCSSSLSVDRRLRAVTTVRIVYALAGTPRFFSSPFRKRTRFRLGSLSRGAQVVRAEHVSATLQVYFCRVGFYHC